jgi:hypothetical protein
MQDWLNGWKFRKTVCPINRVWRFQWDHDLGTWSNGRDIRFTLLDGVTLVPYSICSLETPGAGYMDGVIIVQSDEPCLYLYCGNWNAPSGDRVSALSSGGISSGGLPPTNYLDLMHGGGVGGGGAAQAKISGTNTMLAAGVGGGSWALSVQSVEPQDYTDTMNGGGIGGGVAQAQINSTNAMLGGGVAGGSWDLTVLLQCPPATKTGSVATGNADITQATALPTATLTFDMSLSGLPANAVIRYASITFTASDPPPDTTETASRLYMEGGTNPDSSGYYTLVEDQAPIWATRDNGGFVIKQYWAPTTPSWDFYYLENGTDYWKHDSGGGALGAYGGERSNPDGGSAALWEYLPQPSCNGLTVATASGSPDPTVLGDYPIGGSYGAGTASYIGAVATFIKSPWVIWWDGSWVLSQQAGSRSGAYWSCAGESTSPEGTYQPFGTATGELSVYCGAPENKAGLILQFLGNNKEVDWLLTDWESGHTYESPNIACLISDPDSVSLQINALNLGVHYTSYATLSIWYTLPNDYLEGMSGGGVGGGEWVLTVREGISLPFSGGGVGGGAWELETNSALCVPDGGGVGGGSWELLIREDLVFPVTWGGVGGGAEYPGGYGLRVKYVVPSGSVAKDLPRFLLGVQLWLNPDHTYAEDFRVTNEAGTILQSSLIEYDQVSGKVWLYVKTPLLAATDNNFWIYYKVNE